MLVTPGNHLRDAERGATLVEFAFVLPILLLIAIGLIELGLAFRSYITMGSAAKEGARVAAFVGDDIDADCDVVQAIVGELGVEIDLLDHMEIYQVDANGDPVPSKINTYSFDFTGSGDITDCADWDSTVNWPSTDRQVLIGSTALDVVGIRVVSTHRWVSQFPPFTGQFIVDENTIIRLEPEAYE